MAEWDRRDPRWLVADRQDGANVNGWHWEEKSIRAQVQQRVTEIVSNLSISGPGGLRITALTDMTGEAAMTTRKGNRKLAVYDLKLTMAWEGTAEGEPAPVKGTVKVEEFASGSDEGDYMWEVTVEGSGAAQSAAKRAMEVAGTAQLSRLLSSLAKELEDVS